MVYSCTLYMLTMGVNKGGKMLKATINNKEVKLPPGYELVAIKPRSYHPDDEFLYTIVAKGISNFVQWTYNSEDGGCHCGMYYTTKGDAMKRFNEVGAI